MFSNCACSWYDIAGQRELAVRDLRDQEQERREAEQHEQPGRKIDGACWRMVFAILKA